jgi:hypothetical protein
MLLIIVPFLLSPFPFSSKNRRQYPSHPVCPSTQEAGLPDGVFNMVQGEGETGRLLANHPSCDKLSFTGRIEQKGVFLFYLRKNFGF